MSTYNKEQREQMIRKAQDKEGRTCYSCYKINKWLMPMHNMDWEESRCYCDCDYVRDDFGNRISQNEHLQEYYSNEENCKHGSSLCYT